MYGIQCVLVSFRFDYCVTTGEYQQTGDVGLVLHLHGNASYASFLA